MAVGDELRVAPSSRTSPISAHEGERRSLRSSERVARESTRSNAPASSRPALSTVISVSPSSLAARTTAASSSCGTTTTLGLRRARTSKVASRVAAAFERRQRARHRQDRHGGRSVDAVDARPRRPRRPVRFPTPRAFGSAGRCRGERRPRHRRSPGREQRLHRAPARRRKGGVPSGRRGRCRSSGDRRVACTPNGRQVLCASLREAASPVPRRAPSTHVNRQLYVGSETTVTVAHLLGGEQPGSRRSTPGSQTRPKCMFTCILGLLQSSIPMAPIGSSCLSTTERPRAA